MAYYFSYLFTVPGIGGSQIQAKLDRNETKHYWCYKKSSSWFTLWLNIEELLPMAKECWVDNMKLVLLLICLFVRFSFAINLNCLRLLS